MSLQLSLPGILLIAAFAVGLFFVYLCIRDGVVVNRGFVIEKTTKPRLYWLVIALWLLFSLVIFGMGLDTMASERLPPNRRMQLALHLYGTLDSVQTGQSPQLMRDPF